MSKKDLKIAVIGGGSSYTPELIEGFIKRYEELPVRDIYLMDIEEGKEKLEIVGGLAKRMVEKAGVGINIHLTLDRREAIKDADFVVTQFRVGGIDARIRDEKIPLKYDVIGQETTGPGGFAKAQRTIPVILDVCKDIEELAPNAWLINFTNPAGVITETILKHTNVKAIGLCNVPIGMVHGVAKMLEVDSKRVYIDFAGLNHLVWGTHIYLDGEDITEKLIDSFAGGKSLSMKNIPELPWDPEFIKSLGMYPCPYHRYYYLTDQMLKEQKKEAATVGTRGEVVKKLEKELFELYKDPNLNVKPPQLEKRGGAHYSDAACSLISSIYNDKKDIHVVNVRNNGTIADLPDDVVIETNAVVDKNGAHPITIGHVSPKIRGLMQVVKAYEELTIEAGVRGDYYAALQALTIHPLVPSATIAKKILDDIIEQNKEYLPQYK
ncbi:6-phospho-beta-glucosidase [Caldanaerobacter subterraneus subsp. tengcongensis MB4]|uniref:6-phospho-beta-glucosidase n=2 Tax=Caldanaerobacter subterraneus TaxID=911092 RepID=Q8RCS5_CALS4|nr:6-phospho-beta-glucosidase [Caldanaerobacter subterraneus]AAM23629.1 Alpha-galactosidases/6-phospho-beta-glucosidases, family 4 of glycosyl hydrolases [Caldanaerobacter subterraneus subsp. tengcongensis MB4]KKC30640.1 6-phospho-beta-glucosidase [Caldanaerobacter subterraneus subsp. pacificus DSM 12653]MCS3916884.1 6-phospho-beta-glucosidase [Caldanaerobacter subterraneus subsp. tengcongensis MB4]